MRQPSHSSWWTWKPYGLLTMKLEPNKKYKVIDKDLVNGYIILTGKQIEKTIEDAYKELQLEKNKWLLQKLKETNLNYLFKN